MNALAFLALFRAVLAVSEPSQTPPPTPSEASEEKQDAGSNEKDNGNLLKELISATKENRKAIERQNRENSKKSSTDWWIVAFTAMLTAVGAIQLVAMFRQADYMRRGLRVSINAAKSARFSAIAAENAVTLTGRNTAVTERAVVLIESVEAKPQEGVAHPYFRHASVIVFSLKNFGSTVAHGVKVSGNIHFPGGPQPLRNTPEATIAPQGKNDWITSSLFLSFDQDAINNINRNEAALRYDLEVTYSDVFGQFHRYVADGHYVPLLRGFIITASAADS